MRGESFDPYEQDDAEEEKLDQAVRQLTDAEEDSIEEGIDDFALQAESELLNEETDQRFNEEDDQTDSELLEQSLKTGQIELDLSSKGLRELEPHVILSHTEITHLSVYTNDLATLPREISILQKLVSIDLSENRFRQLPEFLTALTRLREISISYNPFNNFPKQLLELANLESIIAFSIGISDIPMAINRLISLKELELSGNGLTALPESIGQLRSLQWLRLNSCELGRLPVSIGQLENLRELQVHSNKLTTLPPGIRWLRNLEELDVSNNELFTIPAQIGQLDNLLVADFSSNRISKVPPTIGLLHNISELNLSNNAIRSLPKELGNLPDSVSVNLEGNPLTEPLPALLGRGTSALLTYLRSLEDGTSQYEAKVLLVGEGNVGKSSLVAALRGDKFIQGRPTTHGIELNRLDLKHPRLTSNLQLNTWDFGGQEVYRITHQFFFSRRALYLLVWKPREGREENNVEGWIRRIRLRVGDYARVIVVATHADERRAELDFESLRVKFPNLLVAYFLVDSQSGRGIAELKAEIAKQASLLPQMGEILSRAWAAARSEVLASPGPQISRLAFERICAEHGLDENSAEILSALLHDLGHIIHYGEDEGLREIVVLQPEWLTKAIGYVLEDTTTSRQGGVLEHSRLRSIWLERLPNNGYRQELYPYFLRLMEKFDVSYRLPDGQTSLVAQLVPYQRPSSVWQDKVGPNPQWRKLRIICRTADEAPGLIAWLTVRNHRFTVGAHWRRGVLLTHQSYSSHAVFELHDNDRDLSLTVIGPSPEYFHYILKDSVEELILQRWRGLAYEFLVPCPQLDEGRQCEGYFSYKSLQRFRQKSETRIVCGSCAQWSDVAQLLTGFGRTIAPLDVLLANMERTQQTLLRQQADAIQRLHRVEIASAETARNIRHALKILSTEVTDCPRLFVMLPQDRSRVKQAISTKHALTLTLWCEEPGSEHPCQDATYNFKPTKEWIARAGPYIRFVAKVLRFTVPLGGAIYAVTLSEKDLKASHAELDLMKTFAEKFPDVGDSVTPLLGKGMSRAEGSGIRSLRSLLFKLDEAQTFGGMRRVQSQSGDLLWVCSEHYSNYDPGLPSFAGNLHSK